MELNTFIEHLDRLGADLQTWPGPLRREAEELVRTSPAAADAYRDAVSLADLLATLPAVAAPSGLADRIGASTLDPWQRLMDWLGAALWRPVLAAGLPLCIGFAIGLAASPTPDEDAYLAADLGLMAFSSSFAELPENGGADEN